MKIRTLNDVTPYIDDFFFMSLNNSLEKDAIVILNPSDSVCLAPCYLRSKRTLDEHIRHVQEHNIKKALVVGEDISFLHKCPSLEYLHIVPSFSAKDFDFSPLYDMPRIKWLECQTIYGYEETQFSNVDYSKIRGLIHLRVTGTKGHCNIQDVNSLETLVFDRGFPATDNLHNSFDGGVLKDLTIGASHIQSLEGIGVAKHLCRLCLESNRRLTDISALASLSNTLVELEIENCGKIRDFSVLSELHKLEHLKLTGSNKIPDLDFVRQMPNLKSLIFRMDVINGDLSMCLNIPYVSIRNRKHYNHKDKDFRKTKAIGY